MIKITKHQTRTHTKASERYIDVTFHYDDGTSWEGAIPIEYRRTGIDLLDSEIDQYLYNISPFCHRNAQQEWLEEQEKFWKDKQKKETWELFQILTTFKWICVSCEYVNANWARRNQDLKEMGYTIATYTSRYCPSCGKKRTFLILVPLPRECYQTSIRGYPFGIHFYYQGEEKWPSDIPKKGKEAEQGCVGCGWYDLETWRNQLNQNIK